MSRATSEATGHRHWATTHSVLPRRPSGQQANKQQSKNTPTLLAILMATAVRRYNTARIAWWTKSRASLEETRHRHRVSIAAITWKGHGYAIFFYGFHRQHIEKGRGSSQRSLFLIGVLHIKQKRRAQLRWVCNLLGGFSQQNYNIDKWFVYCICTLKPYVPASYLESIKTCNFVTFYEFLMHTGMHHTNWVRDFNQTGLYRL